MTGAGPGGALQTEMNAHLNTFVHPHAVQFATMKTEGKTLPDTTASPMVKQAQSIVEASTSPGSTPPATRRAIRTCTGPTTWKRTSMT